jgi:hypothetical protein
MPKGSRVEIVNKEFNKRLVIIVITGKRTVVYLLILFVIFSASCTNRTDDEQGHANEDALLKPLTLRILTIGDATPLKGYQYEFSKIVDMASAMTMEKYNTAFIMEFIPMYEDYVLRVLSGEPADIICSPPETKRLIEEGMLADLTELLPNLYPESYMRIQDIQDEDNPISIKEESTWFRKFIEIILQLNIV